jgi:hypothetical protein
MAVFEYKNLGHLQYDCFLTDDLVVIFNMAVTVSKQKCLIWNAKTRSFFDMTLFEGRPRCQTKRVTAIILNVCNK